MMLLDSEQALEELDGLTLEWGRIERLHKFMVVLLGPAESFV